MRKNKNYFYFLFICFILYHSALFAQSQGSFPQAYIKKVAIGETMTPFSFEAIDGTEFTNNLLILRPIIFFTGRIELSHEIRRWVRILATKSYFTQLDMAWIYNPVSTKFADYKRRNKLKMGKINVNIPIIIDSHSIIGRSLSIEYDIPTLVAIDTDNKLAFIFEGPANPDTVKKIDELIKKRLLPRNMLELLDAKEPD